MRALIACEYSGIVRDALIAVGVDAVSCDLLPTDRPGPHIQGDVLAVLDQGWDLMIAHPPCQHLSSSGARWWPEKQADGRQQQAIDFFMTLANAPIARVCLENPVGIMSTVYQPPTLYCEPWQHGHGETKKTGLWLKNLPPLKPSNIVEGREQRIWKLPPSPDRWKIRSQTYPGIAAAMADQWGKL